MNRKGIICYLKNRDEILLLHVNYKQHGMVWSGVSGYVDENEDEEKAAIREVREEIGVEIMPDQLKRIANFTASNNIQFTIFISTEWNGIPQSKEEDIKEVKWFRKGEVPIKEMHSDMGKWIDLIFKK